MCLRRERVRRVIRDNFHVPLAQRYEQENPRAMRPLAHQMRGELAMREVAGGGLLDAGGHDREPNRQNVE